MREVVQLDFPCPYDDWLRSTAKRIADIENRGWSVEKVNINAKEFVRYCDRKGIASDRSALSIYAAAKARGHNKKCFPQIRAKVKMKCLVISLRRPPEAGVQSHNTEAMIERTVPV